MEIRVAYLDDARHILDVYNDAIRVLGYPRQDILTTFEAMIQEKLSFVLCEAGVVQGFVSARVDAQERPVAFMSALYVRAEQQRQGLGGQLLRHLEACLREKSLHLIVLKALKAEGGAISFYTKNHYRIIDEDTAREKGLEHYLPIKAYEYCMLKEV